jgi:hypothetical protein
MNAQKSAATEPTQGKLPTGRKPWKKKTPAEIVLAQADRLRSQIAEREEERKGLRKQLQKFDEARKIFESA